MAKILLTGHTSNIGKPLSDFLKQEHDIVPISRSSGYDLTNKNTFDNVVNMSLECDHVINLAYIKTLQTELLYSIYNLWHQNDKYGKIISVGSLGTTASYKLHKQINTETELIANKLSLEKLHNELSLSDPFNKQPQSVLIRLAAFGNRQNMPSLNTTDMNNLFKFILDQDCYISTIDIRRTL